MQKHIYRRDEKVKYLLIAYFLSNICAKIIRNRFICVRDYIAIQSSDIFFRHNELYFLGYATM